MFCTEVNYPKAIKQHRCKSCGEDIEVGEVYVKWTSFEDSAFTNKMQKECYEIHNSEGGTWEYQPYSYPRCDK